MADMYMRSLASTDAAQAGNTTNVKVPSLSGQGATVTLTAAQSGTTCLFDRAAGIVYTLPAPAAGLKFRFITTVAVTLNANTVVTDAATTFLLGAAQVGIAAGTGSLFIADGTSHIKVTSNGSTTGGLKGSIYDVECVDGTHWNVSGQLIGSGTVATPFST